MNPRPHYSLESMAADIHQAVSDYALIHRRQGGTSHGADFMAEMAAPVVVALRRVAVEYIRDESGSHLPPGEINGLVEDALRAAQAGDPGVREAAA